MLKVKLPDGSVREYQNRMRAADVAAESRRAVAEHERRGERYCPLDPDRTQSPADP